jgi:hypothetical protein
MDKNRQDIRYEELYNRLLERGMALHDNNKKRIRNGLVFLLVFSVMMILIRMITSSDRVVFLILWVIGMFAASVYLISVEYIDDSIRKTLEDVSDREAGFDELLPDSDGVREMVQTRIQEKHEELQSRYFDRRREEAPESEGEK